MSGGQHTVGAVTEIGAGTVFKIGPDGTFTNLYVFSSTDGRGPIGALTKGSDGNFYGTASGGGTKSVNGLQDTRSGTLTTLR